MLQQSDGFSKAEIQEIKVRMAKHASACAELAPNLAHDLTLPRCRNPLLRVQLSDSGRPPSRSSMRMAAETSTCASSRTCCDSRGTTVALTRSEKKSRK